MKIVSILRTDYGWQNIKKEKYWNHLVLETIEDFNIYKVIDEKVKAHQSVNLWFGFHSQKFRDTIGTYAQHEAEGSNGMAQVMATYTTLAQMSGKDVNLANYCLVADNIVAELYQYMKETINKGKFIRINKSGGTCSIGTDLSEYAVIQDINELELHQFLLNGEIDTKFVMNNKTVVIENASYIPQVVERYCKLTSTDPKTIQVITSFKQKSILFKDEDYIKFFMEGVANGLENIVFETSAQDERNIRNLKRIFEFIANKFPEKIFNIFIATWKKDLFETELPNIKVIYL